MENFDFELYCEELAKIKANGTTEDVEAFLLGRLGGADNIYGAGYNDLDDLPIEQIHQEIYEWMQVRLQAQITMRNDLICLYRETEQFSKCPAVFQEMYADLKEMELSGTPLHARILLNEAAFQMQTGDIDGAYDSVYLAGSIFEKFNEQDRDTMIAVYNIISEICRQRGAVEEEAEYRAKLQQFLNK